MEIHSPYTPPKEIGNDLALADIERKKSFWKRSIWIAIALFLIFPGIWLIGTIISMRRSFAALGNGGVEDPAALSAAIGETIIATAAGFIYSIPALIFLIISLIRFRSYRKKLRMLTI